jgi:hypothetical protein
MALVSRYFALSGGFGPARTELRTPSGRGDPLYAVWAEVGTIGA